MRKELLFNVTPPTSTETVNLGEVVERLFRTMYDVLGARFESEGMKYKEADHAAAKLAEEIILKSFPQTRGHWGWVGKR